MGDVKGKIAGASIRHMETLESSPDLAERVRKMHSPGEAYIINAILRRGYNYGQSIKILREAEIMFKSNSARDQKSQAYKIFLSWNALRSGENRLEYPTSAGKLSLNAAKKIMETVRLNQGSHYEIVEKIKKHGQELKSKDPAVRLAAAKALARLFNGPEFSKLPKQYAQDANTYAAADLARIFYKKDERIDIRLAALEALKGRKEVFAGNLVIDALSSDLSLGDPQRTKLALELASDYFKFNSDIAVNLNSRGAIRKMLDSNDPNIVRLALRTLAVAGDEKALPKMQGIMHGKVKITARQTGYSDELKKEARKAIIAITSG